MPPQSGSALADNGFPSAGAAVCPSNHRENLRNCLFLDFHLHVSKINCLHSDIFESIYFSEHNNCLVLMDLCLYEPFPEISCVVLPEMPWEWGNTATLNKAVGSPWMK